MATIKKIKKSQNGSTTKTVDINKANGAFAPIAVSKSKYDSVLNKRRASMDSSRGEFNKKLKEAKEKIKLSPFKEAVPKQKVVPKQQMGGRTMRKVKSDDGNTGRSPNVPLPARVTNPAPFLPKTTKSKIPLKAGGKIKKCAYGCK